MHAGLLWVLRLWGVSGGFLEATTYFRPWTSALSPQTSAFSPQPSEYGIIAESLWFYSKIIDFSIRNSAQLFPHVQDPTEDP